MSNFFATSDDLVKYCLNEGKGEIPREWNEHLPREMLETAAVDLAEWQLLEDQVAFKDETAGLD